MNLCTSKFSSRRNSRACNNICPCPLCLKSVKKTQQCNTLGDPSHIALPNQSAYKFILDQIRSSFMRSKLNFNIMDSFFFESDKVSSYYHNNQDGAIICSNVKGLKQVQRILMDKRYKPAQPPKSKIEKKYQTAKETVARKIKNIIGTMTLNDGSVKLLNELNLSYEINTTKNICFIKSFHNSKLIPVYYKHQESFQSDLSKRARTFLKVISKQITPFQVNYITKQQENEYEQEIKKQSIQRYLLYRTCKLVQLTLMNDCVLIKSGIFIWVIDDETTTIYLGNAHQIRYSLQQDPDELLKLFMDKKKNRVQRKLSTMLKTEQKQKLPSSRVQNFSKILESSFKIAVDELAPNIELHKAKQKIDLDEAFKKFHPDLSYNLSDIVGNNQKFNSEMKRLFTKRMFKSRHYGSMSVAENPEGTKSKVKCFESQQITARVKSIHKTRTFKTASHKKLSQCDFNCRKTTDSKRYKMQRLSTEFSSAKIFQ